MPASNLQFTANFKTVNSTLVFEKIRGKINLKDVYYVFPANHKGIVYLFHGSNGSTSSWTGNQENKNLIKDLIAEGFAVIITESEEETLNTDTNGDGSLRWDASTLDSNLNVDFANLKAITDTFYNRGYTNRGMNRYTLGQSNGGSFSISFGYYFNLKASIAFCSSGGATGGAVNITTTPTMFCLAGADNNSTMGLSGNANAITNSQSISSRGVCSKHHTNNPSPLYDQRFSRNSIISAIVSTQIFNEIKNNNFLNTKNYFIGYIQALWNAVAATPQNFPVISALSTSQKNVVEEQIRCVTADHQFYSEYNKSAIRFFNYQCQSQIHSTTLTQCDSYNWPLNGISYTSSGTYTSITGCNIEVLNLSINSSTHNKTTATACDSYTWSRNGSTYSTSGTYLYTYTNGSGCASADSLKLTIKQKSSSTTTISNCVSYTWNGVTYSASGSYTKTGLTNVAGCDSIAYLSLTIKQKSTSTTNKSNCVSYTWNGVTYTASGSYTKTGLTNAVGCDSTAYLSLTIKQATTSTSPATVDAVNLPYIWNGVTYTSTGVYTVKLVNAVGCDSTAILNLTVNPYNQNTILILKLFLEGVYISNGFMRTTLYDLGLSTVNDATDTISINLWKSNHLSNNYPDYTVKALLHSNGSVSSSFPPATYGNSYYIAIKHKNVLETWTALPVTIGATNRYDFTTNINKAFSNGINLPMKNMGNNKFAFLSGDLNLDGGVDIFDMQPIENDASQFYFGYYITDCTGDGAVDISDMQIVENNSTQFLFFARPY